MGDVHGFPGYLTKQQLAEHYQVSTRWIELRCRPTEKKPMPHRKLGRSVRFRLDEVEPWLEELQ